MRPRPRAWSLARCASRGARLLPRFARETPHAATGAETTRKHRKSPRADTQRRFRHPGRSGADSRAVRADMAAIRLRSLEGDGIRVVGLAPVPARDSLVARTGLEGMEGRDSEVRLDGSRSLLCRGRNPASPPLRFGRKGVGDWKLEVLRVGPRPTAGFPELSRPARAFFVIRSEDQETLKTLRQRARTAGTVPNLKPLSSFGKTTIYEEANLAPAPPR